MLNKYFRKDITINSALRPFKSIEHDVYLKDILYIWLNNSYIKLKPSTISKYEYLIKAHIVPSLGDIKVSELNSFHINNFLTQKIECGRMDNSGGLSPSYVKSMMLIIDSAVNFAINESICNRNRLTIYKPPVKKQGKTILSASEQLTLEKALLQNTNSTELAVMIALYTGMRLGEICSLQWKDVDFYSKKIHINSTISRINTANENGGYSSTYVISSPKTSASVRSAPIHSRLYPLLLTRKSLSSSPFVISKNNTFTNPRTLEHQYRQLLQKHNLPYINFHSLRHTFATRCIEKNMDMKTLSELLGHSSVSFTMDTYVHSSWESKRKQIEKLICSGESS